MLKRIALAAVCLVLLVFVVVLFDLPDRLRFRMKPVEPLPEAATVDANLVGDYYMGDGLGVNQRLTLKPNGKFHCNWTGCLGDYGSTTGRWGRDGDTIYVSASNATDMFLRSPLENMKLVTYDEQPHLIPMDWLDFVAEHGDGSIPMAAFSPTD